MKLSLIVGSLFSLVASPLYPMELPEFKLQIEGDEKVFCSVSSDLISSIPSLKKIVEEGGNSKKFPQSTIEDLEQVKKYIGYRYSLYLLPSKEAEKVFYEHAKGLDPTVLSRLTCNACLLFPHEKNTVPQGLLNPLVAKVQSGAIRNVFDVGLSHAVSKMVIDKTKKLSNDYRDTIELLKGRSSGTSVIVDLCAPYSKALDESISLPSYNKSLCELLYQPVHNYVYVGNDIIVSLVGSAHQSCPYVGYVLHIYKKDGTHYEHNLRVDKTLELEKKLDFNDSGMFANKKESLFVCPYSDAYDNTNEGLFLINVNDNTTKRISFPYQAYCFGSSNEIYSFDPEKEHIIVAHGEDYSIKNAIAHCPGVKGMVYNDLHDELIIWTKTSVSKIKIDTLQYSYLIEKPVNIYQYSGMSPLSIERGIINSSGTYMSIKILYQGFVKYIFLDLENNNSLWHCPHNYSENIGRCCEFFSQDGNLFIIGFVNKNGKNTYRFYDLLSLKHWNKVAKGTVVGGGAGKSIEMNKRILRTDVACVSLVDQDMSDVLELLTSKISFFSQGNTLDIAQALLSKSEEQIFSVCPPVIHKVFTARPGEVHSSLNNEPWSFSTVWHKIFAYRYYCGGIALITAAALVWKYKIVKG